MKLISFLIKIKFKNSNRILVLLLIFSLLSIFQYIFFNSELNSKNIEIININENYTLLDNNNELSYNLSMNIKISIFKPTKMNNPKYPIVILLHGDNSNNKILNYLIINFIKNQYMICTLEYEEFNYLLFLKLNSTLNYILNRSDVDSERIGIIGHSHGGHYALLFSILRNDSIKIVECLNFGSMDYWLQDFYEFYKYFIAKNIFLPNSYQEYIDQGNELTHFINFISSNNILFVTDNLDFKKDFLSSEFYLKNFTNGAYSEINKLFGNFSDRTARKMFVTTSIFMHASSILLPSAIYEEIQWMNLALNIENNYLNFQNIFWLNFSGIFIICLEVIISLAIFFYIIPNFYSIQLYFDRKFNLNNSSEKIFIKTSKKVLFLFFTSITILNILILILNSSKYHLNEQNNLGLFLKDPFRSILILIGIYPTQYLFGDYLIYPLSFYWCFGLIILQLYENKRKNNKKSHNSVKNNFISEFGSFQITSVVVNFILGFTIFITLLILIKLSIFIQFGNIIPTIIPNNLIYSVIILWILLSYIEECELKLLKYLILLNLPNISYLISALFLGLFLNIEEINMAFILFLVNLFVSLILYPFYKKMKKENINKFSSVITIFFMYNFIYSIFI